MTTIAQKIIKSSPKFLNYDFNKRAMRRLRDGITQMQLATAKRNLLDFQSIAKEKGLRFWLMYGTLLGCIRDNDFIYHDTDTDLAILETDRDALINTIKALLENGFDLIRTKAPDDLVTIMRDDEYIDIGIFRIHRDILFRKYYAYQNNVEYGSVFENFIKKDFLGQIFDVPENYKLLLTRWYGSDWHTRRKEYPASVYELDYLSKLQKRFREKMTK